MLSNPGPWLFALIALFLASTKAGSSPSYGSFSRYDVQLLHPAPTNLSSSDDEAYRALRTLKRQDARLKVPCAPAAAPEGAHTISGDGKAVCLPRPDIAQAGTKPAGKRSFSKDPSRRRTLTTAQSRSSKERLDHEIAIEKRITQEVLHAFGTLPLVGLDDSTIVKWQSDRGTVDMSRGLAVALCGGTIAVVSSPVAVIVAHVWESRAESYLTFPGGIDQKAAVSIARRGQ
jgi:hypothetical protein